ncbi:MAG: ABC transporter substrate-binding protein [Lachnospiraceae bacterium]|nr:ABC transporter substrate-binding protein [Lachnospiraceae bacterium]
MHIRTKIIAIASIVMIGLSGFSGCGSPSSVINGNNELVSIEDISKEINNSTSQTIPQEADISNSLSYAGELDREYAKKYRVFYYDDGYTLLMTVDDNARFLIVPEDKEIPQDVNEDVCVIKRPVDNMYIVASAIMDMFAELDAIDSIRYSGKKQADWYIKEAADAMQRGDMLYAGKYSKPDYEMIVSGDCSLIIENTMIFHSPEVKEKFEGFGIPVMVEYSNYEDHPLARVEWVKFFGALLGEDEAAKRIYEDQRDIVNAVIEQEGTDKTVAYFYMTSNNLVQVRKTSDYIPKMIELAGGRYIYDDLDGNDSNMSIEQFYADAKNADIIIYNSSIDGGVASLEELYAKSELFRDFKAVKESNVWCTTNDMYQQSLSVGYMIEDINNVLNEKDDNLHYLFRLQ